MDGGMKGWTDGWMDGRMDRWMNGQTNRPTDGRVDGSSLCLLESIFSDFSGLINCIIVLKKVVSMFKKKT